MSIFGGGGKSQQAYVPPPVIPPTAPTAADPAVQGAGNAAKGAPPDPTMATGPGGLTTQASTTRKSLLGG